MDLEKNIQRVEMMVTQLCGCTDEQAVIVLEECLNNYKNKIKQKQDNV